MVETPAPDEAGTGVALAPLPERPVNGFGPVPKGSQYAQALSERMHAGKAAKRAAELRLFQSFGLDPETVPAPLLEHLVHAEVWVGVEVERLRREIGGGTASTAVCALVQSAALAMAQQRLAVAEGRHSDARGFGAEVRANVLAAHHLAGLEARARAVTAPQWSGKETGGW